VRINDLLDSLSVAKGYGPNGRDSVKAGLASRAHRRVAAAHSPRVQAAVTSR